MAAKAREPCGGQITYRLRMAALLLYGLLLLALGLIAGTPPRFPTVEP
jgi:hypothetical protein